MEADNDWSLVRSDAREAAQARDAIRRFLACRADPSSDLDAAELIVGELVANVVRHAPGPIGLYVGWEETGAVLVVTDRGPGVVPLRCVPDGAAEHGRGLLLVRALATRLTIDSSAGEGSRIVVGLPVWRQLPASA